MKLQGSCHCGAVQFSVVSAHAYPFNLCYCSICRKTAGGGGYAINLSADSSTLVVQGEESISTYQALMGGPGAGALEKNGSKKSTPEKITPEKATPEKATPEKATPEKATPEKATPEKATPEKATFEKSPAQRKFCRYCGSALWLWDPRWPELLHPFASAIDTPLPVPPERTHLMMDSKAPWVVLHVEAHDQVFGGYPRESIAEWHKRLGLEDPD